MKLGFLAASAWVGVVSLVPASFAQSDTMSQSARSTGAVNSAARVAIPDKVPALESARPAAGMLPEQPTGPIRGTTNFAFDTPGQGGDLRRSLRRQ